MLFATGERCGASPTEVSGNNCMLRKILTHPNKILHKKSVPVKPEIITSKKFHKLLEDMAETMIKKDGVGLAAPQIGESIRVIVVNTKDGILALINPEITKKSWRQETDEEGCLSVPGVYGYVKRPAQISVTGYTQCGEKTDLKAKGLMARVIQHEIDHLGGILFIDKATRLKQTTQEL
jgi:peptide deformylase